MSDPHKDAERIAALLDGRLNVAERARLLAELDASPELLEAYSDAIAVRSEIEDSSPQISAPLGWTRRPGVIGLLAAAMILAMAMPIVRRAARGSLPTSVAISGLLASADAESVSREGPWPARRGEASPIQPAARAVRVGARIVDLTLLVRARAASSGFVATEISTWLADAPAGAQARSEFDAIAAIGSATSEQQLASAADAAEGILGRRETQIGAWLEGARIAARRADSTYFRGRAGRNAMKAITAWSDETGIARTTFAELHSVLAQQAVRWDAVELTLNSALRELGR